jgi:ELWxxDGT repeat protein
VNRSLGHPLLLALLLALVVPPEVSTHRATADLPVPYLIQGVAATNLTDIDGTLYFSGMTSDFGFEPWKSDGTLAGTHQIKDIHDQNENYGYSSDPDGFTRIAGGIVLFTALTGDAPSGVPTYGEGEELWRTDGTLAGTWLVKDIRPGPESAFSTSRDRLGTLNGVAYFAANNGLDGYELWRSDGTSAGTVMLKDIRPGAHSSFPGFFTEYNGLLYFQADDGTGTELWRTDGTSGGTQMVRNINPGGSSNPREMTVAGGWLYFSATDGVTGAELWKTDGTEAGTSLVVDLRDGSAINPAPSALTELNGQVAFRAVYTFQGITCGPELFVSDGTAAGTTLIDIEPGCGRSDLSGLVNANGRLFFAASDGSAGGAQAGLELWSSDGTAAGTLLVRDINPGLPSSNPQFLTPANGFVYFSAATALDGIELWRTDGTPAGTQLVGDLADGPASSQPQEITVSGNTLFFRFGQNAGAYPVWSLFAMELTVDEPLPPIITPVITGTLEQRLGDVDNRRPRVPDQQHDRMWAPVRSHGHDRHPDDLHGDQRRRHGRGAGDDQAGHHAARGASHAGPPDAGERLVRQQRHRDVGRERRDVGHRVLHQSRDHHDRRPESELRAGHLHGQRRPGEHAHAAHRHQHRQDASGADRDAELREQRGRLVQRRRDRDVERRGRAVRDCGLHTAADDRHRRRGAVDRLRGMRGFRRERQHRDSHRQHQHRQDGAIRRDRAAARRAHER